MRAMHPSASHSKQRILCRLRLLLHHKCSRHKLLPHLQLCNYSHTLYKRYRSRNQSQVMTKILRSTTLE